MRSKQPRSGDDVRRCDHHRSSAQEYDEHAAQLSAALFREQVDDQVERLPKAVLVLHAREPQRLNSSPRSNTTALMASAKKMMPTTASRISHSRDSHHALFARPGDLSARTGS